MPVLYGSNFPLPVLSAVEVGVWIAPARPNLGWLSILLNVIEVGASIFLGPEVGTAIALANAGAQTGINYAETGKVDALGAGINFGSVIIPGIAQGVKNALTAGKYVRVGTELKEAGDKAIDGLLHKHGFYEGKIEQGGFTDMRPVDQAGFRNTMVGKNASDWMSKVNAAGDRPALTAAQLQTNAGRQGLYAGKNGGFFTNPTKLLEGAPQRVAQSWSKTLKGSPGIAQRMGERTAARVKYFKESLSGAGITGVGETATDIGADTENKIFRVIKDETGLFYTEIKALKATIKEGEIINLKGFRSILLKAFNRTGNDLLELALEGAKQGKFIKLITRTETTAQKLARIASRTMSSLTKIGGYMVSPSSLAADAISKTVAKLTSKVEAIGEELAEKMAKWVKLGAKGMAKAEEEFERTGGVLIKSSWLMGFKELEKDPVGSTILIQFKNQHPNVITKLTEGELLAFIESSSKGRWYINNVARSRGGRSLKELGLEGKLENLLGMLPIGQINEIIGFASFSKSFVEQIKSNSGTFIWQTGDYIEGFKNGVIQGIISEGIKATVALGTRNQYAKQVLEGGFGAVASGTSFGQAFSSSFAGGAQSMKDTIFEDTTKAGGVVKNVKVIQGTQSSLKGVF